MRRSTFVEETELMIAKRQEKLRRLTLRWEELRSKIESLEEEQEKRLAPTGGTRGMPGEHG